MHVVHTLLFTNTHVCGNTCIHEYTITYIYIYIYIYSDTDASISYKPNVL